MKSEVARPRDLGELFEVFERLEQGVSVRLAAPDGGCVERTEFKGRERGEDQPAPDVPSLGVYSSGSTGRPKLIWRTWEELRREARVQPRYRGWAWASPFSPSTYAGVQVALQAWSSQGGCVGLSGPWEGIGRTLDRQRPDVLCCTPTFALLLALNAADATGVGGRGAWAPKQVTLGGEVLSAAVGTRLKARWAAARFTVIYASAEHGSVLRTHRLDGQYEAAQLGAGGVDWRVADGQLELWREGRWQTTRDRVEVAGGLMRIVGRGDAVANVGGTKVSLAEVASVAEEVGGVWRAQAWARSNAVTGQVVALRYAIDPGMDAAEVRGRLEAHVRARLPKAAWPRAWERAELGLGQNAKGGWRTA